MDNTIYRLNYTFEDILRKWKTCGLLTNIVKIAHSLPDILPRLATTAINSAALTGLATCS
jgi:hypothetical protein